MRAIANPFCAPITAGNALDNIKAKFKKVFSKKDKTQAQGEGATAGEGSSTGAAAATAGATTGAAAAEPVGEFSTSFYSMCRLELWKIVVAEG